MNSLVFFTGCTVKFPRGPPVANAPVHEEGDFKLLRDGAEAAEVHVLHP